MKCHRMKEKTLRYLMYLKRREMDQYKHESVQTNEPRFYTQIKKHKLTQSVNRGNDDIICIDAKENRYIVLSEIPVVFLHADMEDNLHMLLEVTIAEMINELDPTICRKHIGSTNKESQC